MVKIILKADGSQEPFNIQKFRDSLKRTGVQDQLIDEMTDQIEKITNIKLFSLPRHQKDLVKLALTDYEIKTILDEANGVSKL